MKNLHSASICWSLGIKNASSTGTPQKMARMSLIKKGNAASVAEGAGANTAKDAQGWINERRSVSENLYWRPIVPVTGHSLPDALKFKLRDKLDLANGSSTLGHNMIGYLSGLQDCGIEGAKELIDAIQKHEQVEVFLQ